MTAPVSEPGRTLNDRDVARDDQPRNLRMLLGVGGAYLLLQQTLLSLHRAVSWDEAVYLSQVTPGMQAMPFLASRARGITLLAWPATQLGASLAAVRLAFSVASSGALVAAYAVWIPIVGIGAPVAAVAFGSTWLALLYGSEVMPNLWVALLAVAATGMAVRRIAGARVGHVWIASVLLALLGLFRPPDSVPVLLAVLAAGVGVDRLRMRERALLFAGALAGWIPWLAEMSVRFGGPLEAIRSATNAAQVGTTSIGDRVIRHLAVTNGPVLGPPGSPQVPIGGVVWWLALMTFASIGLLHTWRGPTFRPLLAATLAGAGLAAEYLVLVEGVAPRFLLPAYALLSIPASVGIVQSFRLLRRRPAAAVFFALLVATPWFVWQLGTADRMEAQTNDSRVPLQQVASAMRNAAAGRPCSFASTDAFPQIAYAARCDGRPVDADFPVAPADLESLAMDGGRVFLVTQEAEPPQTANTVPRLIRVVSAPRGELWFLYELVAPSALHS